MRNETEASLASVGKAKSALGTRVRSKYVHVCTVLLYMHSRVLGIQGGSQIGT